jgi:hypothetical protein
MAHGQQSRAIVAANERLGVSPQTYDYRHTREGGYPEGSGKNWIPVCTGMTEKKKAHIYK